MTRDDAGSGFTDAAREWDAYANEFDEAADHGLRDPDVRAAWSRLLVPLLPEGSPRVADLGCGTGSLSVLLAENGAQVTGLDFSATMLEHAEEKARLAGVQVAFVEGDAALPPFAPASFDVVLTRHVLWALPDREAALHRWCDLLAPGGRLVLIEGSWSTGAGLTAHECRDLVLRHRAEASIRDLSAEPRLWGQPVDDERYLVLSLS